MAGHNTHTTPHTLQEAKARLLVLPTELLQEAMESTRTHAHGRFRCEGSVGIGFRSDAAYPGVRTGDGVYPGEEHDFTSQCVVNHTLAGGRNKEIFFYKMADGRG